MRFKICGMKHSDNILDTATLQPDYLGFIFYKKSPRYLEGGIPALPKGILRTGVFVNASEEEILEKVREHSLEAVQLHGEESPELCAALQKRSLEVIKVFSVKEEFDFQLLKIYEAGVDRFLFDTKGAARGGNGVTFNWELLKDYNSKVPFILSGGIGLEELDAIESLYGHFEDRQKQHLFYGVDVNSRFETSPGLKDLQRLKEFATDLKGSFGNSSRGTTAS